MAPARCAPSIAQNGMPANEELVAAAAELRRAFSHIESPDTHICAWLDENQKAALQRYQVCNGLKGKCRGSPA